VLDEETGRATRDHRDAAIPLGEPVQTRQRRREGSGFGRVLDDRSKRAVVIDQNTGAVVTVAQFPEGGGSKVGSAQWTVEVVGGAVVGVGALVVVLAAPAAGAPCPARSGPMTTTTSAPRVLETGGGVGRAMTVVGARPRADATAPASLTKPGV
jgi:hypothetical protein